MGATAEFNAEFYISKTPCRDDDDNFYDRTEGLQRQKRTAQPEALDAATLLGQKVQIRFYYAIWLVLCCAMLLSC